MIAQRITRKKVEAAQKLIASAKEQMSVVKAWNEAVGEMTGVDAITINADGTVRFEILKEVSHVHREATR